MSIHLINPSHISFGIAVITPRWLYVLAAATPRSYGDPIISDETLDQIDPLLMKKGDIVGIGIHTGNALRGYEIGRTAKERGATVIFGGIHATLFPEEALQLGGASAVVKGDGDVIWATVLEDCRRGELKQIYDGGKVAGDFMLPARWDLLPRNRYIWGSVQTLRGCPKHCSFCSVWRTDGQQPRYRTSDAVVGEIVELRRRGFRFIALADDNFYPVSLGDLSMAQRRKDPNTAGGVSEHPGGPVRTDGAAGKAASRHGFLHSDHDGSGGRSCLSGVHAEGQHQGGTGGSGIGDVRRAQVGPQELQPD